MRTICIRSCISSIRNIRSVRSRALTDKIDKNTALQFATSTTVDIADPIVEAAEETKQIDARFPWRDAPRPLKLSLTEYVTHHAAKTLIEEIHFNTESAIGPGSSYMEVDFIVGARQAFEAALSAIFQHKRMRAGEVLYAEMIPDTDESGDNTDNKDINGGSGSGGSNSSIDKITKENKEKNSVADMIQDLTKNHVKIVKGGDDIEKEMDKLIQKNESKSENSDESDESDKIEEGKVVKDVGADDWKKGEVKREDNKKKAAGSDDASYVPDLRDLFDPKLSDFYENAIETSHKLGHRVFHKAEVVGTPTIVNYDILYGGKRGIDLTGLMRKKWMGVLPYLAPLEKKAVGFSDENQYEKNNKSFQARRFGTIRITLSIKTKEIFYVENAVTALVIQGVKEPVINTHMVLFETVIAPNVEEYEWKICDIDDWLDGNEFWQPTKLKKKY